MGDEGCCGDRRASCWIVNASGWVPRTRTINLNDGSDDPEAPRAGGSSAAPPAVCADEPSRGTREEGRPGQPGSTAQHCCYSCSKANEWER